MLEAQLLNEFSKMTSSAGKSVLGKRVSKSPSVFPVGHSGTKATPKRRKQSKQLETDTPSNTLQDSNNFQAYPSTGSKGYASPKKSVVVALQQELTQLRESEKAAQIELASSKSTIVQLESRLKEKAVEIEWYRAQLGQNASKN